MIKIVTMEIKTTKEIKDSKCFAQSYMAKKKHDNQKWVDVDDFNNKIEEIFSEGWFNYFHQTYSGDNMNLNEEMINDINKKVEELKASLIKR